MSKRNSGAPVVVITGASAGVGRATARLFARHGARLGLIARGTDGLEAARREAIEAGTDAVAAPADVADAEALASAADRIAGELGPIDIWVNNAMTSVFARARDVTPAEFRRVTDVTYLGTVNGTLTALRYMVPRNRGVIVQVGSALAFRGIPLQSAYCGAKHAIRGFTESVRTELEHDGSDVEVIMVHLPALNTPQFDWVESRLPRRPQPVPPIFQPEVAARAIVHAAFRPRRQMLVAWPTVRTVWADRFAPRFSGWYAARTGYDAQQTDEPADPVPGDHGAHGAFDKRAKSRSVALQANLHRGLTLGAVAGVLAAAAAAAAGLRR